MKLRRLHIFILFFLLCLCGFLAWVWQQMQPVEGSASSLVNIPKGATSRQIAALLEQKGLIRNSSVFEMVLWWKKDVAHLQAGTYSFHQGMTIWEIMQKLKSGNTIPNTVRFTIPEGFTIEQIAKRLSSQGLADPAAFISEADHGEFKSPVLVSIPQAAPLRHRLEGYLFPSTYEIYKGSSPHEIIQLMIDRMQQAVTPDLEEKWRAEGLTIHEGLTLASLVEREALVQAERPEIARVILNRLHAKPPMPLQIDATIQYLVGQKPELTYADLKRESPYNSYLHLGLPPGPIASPGEASVAASSMPAANAYLYYVTKKDGSGEHYFAKTYEQQLANEQLSLQNERKGAGR